MGCGPADKSAYRKGIQALAANSRKAKMEGEAQTVAIVLVPLKGKLVIITYWATAAKEKAHEAEIGKIVNSLKAL